MLAEAVGEQGKVFVVNTTPGISSTDQREHGFAEDVPRDPLGGSGAPPSWSTRALRTPSDGPGAPSQKEGVCDAGDPQVGRQRILEPRRG
jgi:hypothetical protein